MSEMDIGIWGVSSEDLCGPHLQRFWSRRSGRAMGLHFENLSGTHRYPVHVCGAVCYLYGRFAGRMIWLRGRSVCVSNLHLLIELLFRIVNKNPGLYGGEISFYVVRECWF